MFVAMLSCARRRGDPSAACRETFSPAAEDKTCSALKAGSLPELACGITQEPKPYVELRAYFSSKQDKSSSTAIFPMEEAEGEEEEEEETEDTRMWRHNVGRGDLVYVRRSKMGWQEGVVSGVSGDILRIVCVDGKKAFAKSLDRNSRDWRPHFE